MRKIPVLVTVLGLVSLSLVGCTAVGAPGCTRPAEADAELRSQVSVTGEPGSEPKVSIGAPLHVEKSSVWETVDGSGTPITADDQLVALDVAVYNGTTGEKTVATKFDGDATRTFSMAQWIETFPQFGTLMQCATPGSRVVMSLAPDGVAEAARSGLQLGAADSSVVVVDVTKTYLTRATGSTVFNDAHNMPTVVRAPSGQPGIIVPEATAPKSVSVQTLIRGDGETLKDTDTAVVAYTGVPWESGAKVFDTTWGATPATTPVGSATIPGFAEALKGQKVGSQVLVVVPADKVPADTTATVPSGKTLVYVIDVLGIAPAAAAAQ